MAQGHPSGSPEHTPHQGRLPLVPAGPRGQQERFVQDALHPGLRSWSVDSEICIQRMLTEPVTAVTHGLSPGGPGLKDTHTLCFGGAYSSWKRLTLNRDTQAILQPQPEAVLQTSSEHSEKTVDRTSVLRGDQGHLLRGLDTGWTQGMSLESMSDQ